MINEKKKILFVNNNFDTGGVQRSLINLLNLISGMYDITLFVFSNSGEYKDCLSKEIEVIEASKILRLLGISQKQAKSKGVMLYFFRAMLVLYTKIINNNMPIRLLISTQKKMMGFDTAISFLHNCTGNILYGGCNEFVLRRVDAKQKISFLHCDFLEYGGNTLQNREMYEHFDKIAAVSEGCKKSFIKAVPKLETKTYCVGNCHNYPDYKAMANDNPIEYSKDFINVITVARLGSEKGILRAVEAVHKLVKEDYKIKWHIVGDGPQKLEIEDKVRKLGITENILFYGNQQNPYRYIKNVDLFLLPSFHEAAPMVINESKCLGVPVVATNTTSANEMILENKEGFVCENSVWGIYQKLKLILDQPQNLYKCSEYLVEQNYNNEIALSQFHSLIG